MNKEELISAGEAKLKRIETEVCFAMRGRDQKKVEDLFDQRRSAIWELKNIK